MFRRLWCVLPFFLIACNDSPPGPPPPPPHIPTVQIALEETGVTEVWLKLTLTDAAPPRGYAIRRNGTTILNGTLSAQDTAIVDTSADPNRTYTYLAYRTTDSTWTDSSVALQVITMDTTNHDGYVWTIDTLGAVEGGSQYLADVAIDGDSILGDGKTLSY